MIEKLVAGFGAIALFGASSALSIDTIVPNAPQFKTKEECNRAVTYMKQNGIYKLTCVKHG